jgi:uncharacterized membrane protein YkvA (DUF1232 family)
MKDRLEKIGEVKRIDRVERRRARGALSNLVRLIPNFLKLLARLFKDRRVPTTEKALLVGTIVYILAPLDLLPDVLPFLGQVDDLYLSALVVLRLLSRTPENVLEEHWDGGGDLPGVVRKIIKASRWILPGRIRRVLLGRVEIGKKGRDSVLSSPAVVDESEFEEPLRSGRRSR